MKRLTNEHRWKRTVEWLRLRFPSTVPVKVRRIPLRHYSVDGDCCFTGKDYRIRIEKNQPFSAQMDSLFHEWAHVLSWLAMPGESDHSGSWGLAYAAIYSAFERWNYGKGDK